MDPDQRKMLDDLDARLLLDCCTEARHIDTLSLTTIAVTLTGLGLFAVAGARFGRGLLGLFVELSPLIVLAGLMLTLTCATLRKRMTSAGRHADEALRRLADRHGCDRSNMPDPGPVMIEFDRKRRREQAITFPWLVLGLGTFVAVMGAVAVALRSLVPTR